MATGLSTTSQQALASGSSTTAPATSDPASSLANAQRAFAGALFNPQTPLSDVLSAERSRDAALSGAAGASSPGATAATNPSGVSFGGAGGGPALSSLPGFAQQNMTPAEQNLLAAQAQAGTLTAPFASTVGSGGQFYQVPLSQYPSYGSAAEASTRWAALTDWLTRARGGG